MDGVADFLGFEKKTHTLGVFYPFARAKVSFQQPQMMASKHDFV